MKTKFYAVKNVNTGDWWTSLRGHILFNQPKHAATAFNYRMTNQPKLKDSVEYRLVEVEITEVSR